MDIYAGLDISLTGSGWAILKDDVPEYGTIKTVPKDYSNDLDRYKYIVSTVISKIPKEVSLIVLEDVFIPRANQMGAAVKLMMLAGILRVSLYDAKLPFILAAPTSIKKHLTGSGAAPKDQMAAYLVKTKNILTKNNNECDAVSMSFIARDIHTYLKTGICGTCTKAQAEVAKSIVQTKPSYNLPFKIKKVEIEEDEMPE